MKECEGYESGKPDLYIYYIHGWLLPYLDGLREQKKLKQGTKQIRIDGKTCKYTGEKDD